jgi:hypothetical protein
VACDKSLVTWSELNPPCVAGLVLEPEYSRRTTQGLQRQRTLVSLYFSKAQPAICPLLITMFVFGGKHRAGSRHMRYEI